jgi:outer membrane protein assembly factor BamB
MGDAMVSRFVGVWAILCAALFSGEVIAAEWPQWRGPEGQGHAVAKDLPLTWSEKENITWRSEIPGKGWSSPVLSGNRIWMTTAIDTPLTEEQKKKKLEGNTNNQPLNLSGRLSLRAVCVDRDTGKILHDIETLVQEEPEPIHQLNSFASPSPVLVGDRLFCHFGTNGTACVDTQTGKVVWTNGDLKIKHENGPGSTPVAWNDLLIIHCDGSDVQYIAALEQSTGKIRWKTPRSGKLNDDPQLKKAYGTPLIATLNGSEVVVSPGADWLYGYEPATGKELWKLSYGVLGFSIVPRPVLGGTRLFMSTSFIKPELLAIDLAGEPTIAWRVKKQVPNMPSPLLIGDELYLVADLGVASCLDAKTGDIVWAERLGGNFTASPLFADGRIYVGNREGSTFVIQPGREYKLLATNVLDGAIMATPAAVESSLYLRTDKALYRIGAGKGLAAR